MIPPDIFPFLTQFFFVSSVVMMPIMIFSLIYGKITDQIVFRIEEPKSLFEERKPNPYVKKEMPWLEEQHHLFETKSSNVNREAETPNKPSSIKDLWPNGHRRVTEVHTETESAEVEEEVEVEEEKAFTLAEKVLSGVITEDVERKTPDGIPVTITKGTQVKILLPGFTMEAIEESKVDGKRSEKEEKKKGKDLEKLNEDSELGTVT